MRAGGGGRALALADVHDLDVDLERARAAQHAEAHGLSDARLLQQASDVGEAANRLAVHRRR